MSVEMDEEIKRWKTRRKSALVLDIVQGQTTDTSMLCVLSTPFIKRRRTDPMFAAQIRNRRAGLRPFRHRRELAIRKPRSLHVELPPTRKFYFSILNPCGGITKPLNLTPTKSRGCETKPL